MEERIAAIYYIIINIAAAVAFFMDKQFAKKHLWRIPEAFLLFLAFIGGGVGAFLSMVAFRHKTKHIKFVVLVPAFILLHLALWYFYGERIF